MIQNVFPLISSGVFNMIKKLNIPLVFRCGNFRMFCPNGLLLSHGRLCEKCVGGKEYYCLLNNCENSLPKSLGYSLRTAWTRLSGNVTRNTDMYITQTSFTKNKFVQCGLPAERIKVIPNFVNRLDDGRDEKTPGEFIGFAGRISPEKDIPLLLDVCKNLKNIPLRLAGDYSKMSEITKNVSSNIRFLGHLDSKSLQNFYSSCRFMVLTSKCYEVFPVVLVEAMAKGIPVICSNIGGLSEIVDDGKTGLLFAPGNADELAEKIQYLWDRPDLCWKMGQAAREKVLREYTSEKYYERLIAVFDRAITLMAPPKAQKPYENLRF